MGILDMDFSNVERSNKLPEGEYTFAIETVEDKPSKAGDPMWTLKMSVIEDQFDGAQIGKTQYARLVFGEKSMWSVAQALDAILGVSIEGPLSDYISDPSDLVGKTVGGVVTHKDDFANVTTWFSA
jgi:hypothetical protein